MIPKMIYPETFGSPIFLDRLPMSKQRTSVSPKIGIALIRESEPVLRAKWPPISYLYYFNDKP